MKFFSTILFTILAATCYAHDGCTEYHPEPTPSALVEISIAPEQLLLLEDQLVICLEQQMIPIVSVHNTIHGLLARIDAPSCISCSGEICERFRREGEKKSVDNKCWRCHNIWCTWYMECLGE